LEESKKREEVPLQLLLGDSRQCVRVIQQAQRIAETDFSVLILEKQVLASLILPLSFTD
jgi:transcriptional regulator with PAS, ATPase and Fis domain